MSATMAARARTGASLSAPVRRPQQPARRKSSPWLARMLRAAAQRPGRALIFLMFALASAAIVCNALLFQKARHPHPMVTYAPAEPPRAAAPARRDAAPAPAVEAPLVPVQIQPALPALPPTRPSDLSQSGVQREAAPRPPASVSAAARTAAPGPAPAVQRAAPVRDPIADLINGGDMRPPADVGGRAAQRRTTGN